MRLSAGSLDIDAFRSFVQAAGASIAQVRPASGEVLRFYMGKAQGTVAQRKDGRLTLAGEAKPAYRDYQKTLPPALPGPVPLPKVAQIITATMPAHDYARARELLARAKKVTIHTDGSASYGGLGFGGWAAIIQAGFVTVEIFGGAERSTVNRMEIIAAIAALELLPSGCDVKLKTDSRYLRDGITLWIDGWKRHGWLTYLRTPVKNEDLWKRLDAARSKHKVEWRWVKAHRGHKLNERADELAKHGRFQVQNAAGVGSPLSHVKGTSSDVIAQ